jgi:UDP-D-galactose:(glucosyl)LPS alpha-1,6-D-galactosyltransferase
MKLDILIPVAQMGGVENVINMVCPFCESRGWNVRVVQLVWEGYKWTDDKHFYPLLRGRDGHTLDEFVECYKNFIQENGAPDITLATGWPYACYIAKKASALLGKKWTVISWLHNPLERYEASGYGGYAYLSTADMHFAISSRIADGIRKNIPNSLVFDVRNPVRMPDLSDKPQREKSNLNKKTEKRTMLFVGRISEPKRLEVIIKALVHVKDTWKLRIIGTGEKSPYTEALRKLLEDEKLTDNIERLGWKENPWDFAENVDALVMASEYEGFPLTAIEALAHGIPVIATPVSGIVELVKPGVNGYLFPRGDDGALAEILKAISEGELPETHAEECMETVQIYDVRNALGDFECKLREISTHPEFVIKKKELGELYCNDKISVIIPCYNREKYIGDCLESLTKSDLPLSMLEFIVVDDASTDDTIRIIKEYEKKFPENIMLIECAENGGPGAARNIGLQYASGNYVGFVDSDDKVDSAMFRKLYEKVVLYDCDISSCGYKMFADGNENISKIVSSDEQYYDMNNSDEKKRYIIKNGSMNSACIRMYRRSFLENNGIKFPEKTFMEDLYFSQMCMMRAESCYVMSEPLYYYRQNQNDIMFSDNVSHYFMDTFKMQEIACKELEEKGLIAGFEDEYSLLYYVKAFYEPLWRMLIGEHGIVYDEDNVEMLRKAIFGHFPNILSNAYILSDNSEMNMRVLNILKRNGDYV